MGSKTITVTIDRIEENIAVIELPEIQDSKQTEFSGFDYIELPVKYLPDNVKEGNVLDVTFKINLEEEKKRVNEIERLQQELLNRNNN